MPKFQTMYECSNCGAQYPKWEGRCRQCGKWKTLEEGSALQKTKEDSVSAVRPAQTVSLSEISSHEVKRIKTGLCEFDRVLGGGIVPGSLVLIGGSPGIGKSTLLLQVIANVSHAAAETPLGKESNSEQNRAVVLYLSGEESGSQVKSRFERLGLKSDGIQFSNETGSEKICATILELHPSLVIIDSIQTISSAESSSAPGSQTQVTLSTGKLMETAKKTNTPLFIIGHITKSGVVAGPKTLEHLVDTVLYLEGDKNHIYRIVRSVKNRFGSVDEIGIFEMTNRGLVEVADPSRAFLPDQISPVSGTVPTIVVEGSRPLIVEIQALTSKTYFGYPKRASSGFKKSRLEVLIAILSKRLGLRLGEHDVYINVAGGLKISEPAADLATALAIITSSKDKPLPGKTAVFGELGLGGEVRNVPFFEKRVREAENIGFQYVICPKNHQKYTGSLSLKEIRNVIDAEKALW